jgi:NitT/TauT family transport system ATP-binding protein
LGHEVLGAELRVNVSQVVNIRRATKTFVFGAARSDVLQRAAAGKGPETPAADGRSPRAIERGATRDAVSEDLPTSAESGIVGVVNGAPAPVRQLLQAVRRRADAHFANEDPAPVDRSGVGVRTREGDVAQRELADGTPLIRFQAVSLEFPGGTRALERVSLSVARGELVSIVGPSGCGKSTLLRLVAGFVAPSDGLVSVRGQGLGYVFQEPTLLAWRNVRENVELPAQLAGVPSRLRRARAAAVLARVGLAGFERHLPVELSGGMRMRVSLARALMTDPDVFLFDEPFAALDEITRERLHDELAALFASDSFAGLFVTHSVPEAVFLSTRVLVLSARPGRVAAEFEVPFAWPRRVELRYEPEFGALVGRISAALRSVA